jgi:hypothetical protein
VSSRRFLTFAGADVAPLYRRADGKAVVVYLDRRGNPTTTTAAAWAHELSGHGWQLADVKQLLALLPGPTGSPAPAGPTPKTKPDSEARAERPRAFLSSQYAALAGEDK